jgi:hypothetical protein
MAEKRWQATLDKEARLRELGASPEFDFTFHSTWECEFARLCISDPKLRASVARYKDKFLRKPLRPREALRGGRTNAIRHFVQAGPGTKILYYDFTSLYPAVMYGVNGEKFPVGHPEIYLCEEELQDGPNRDEWFGLVHLTILPPKRLMFPVLGLIFNDKLVFALCRKCAEESRQGYCEHSDKERALTGTFTTPVPAALPAIFSGG